MSVRKFSTASILSPSYKNSKIWDGTTFPGYFESIATVVVSSSGASTITFSNIPQNYTHLQIRTVCRSTSTSVGQDDITVTLNSDSGNNYYWHRSGSSGGGTITGNSGGLTSGSQIQEIVPRDSNSSGAYAGIIMDILDYSNTNKNKVFNVFGGHDSNGQGTIMHNSFLWINTSAITSIVLATANNWKQHSNFALYGIRSA